MPKKQTTAAKKAREKARQGEKYTAALRTEQADADHQAEPQPPRLVHIAIGTCPEGCDGSGHPGAICRPWRPQDVSGRTVRWEVQRAAQLPVGRANQLADRIEAGRKPGTYNATNDAWLLALAYAMLTDQHPELRPDRARLRAAVEADDLAAVDAVMEPLDRTAARLMTQVPAVWWDEVKPLLDAYTDTVEADTRELPTWHEVEERDAVDRLVHKWRTAWTPALKSNGYWDPPGVMWLAPKEWLDAVLTKQHGGHAPGDRVRLADGRPAIVYAAEWGESGPPTAYQVRELVPGTHGNVGRLVPSLHSDELVPAADLSTA
jgi:hypothetical protein